MHVHVFIKHSKIDIVDRDRKCDEWVDLRLISIFVLSVTAARCVAWWVAWREIHRCR